LELSVDGLTFHTPLGDFDAWDKYGDWWARDNWWEMPGPMINVEMNPPDFERDTLTTTGSRTWIRPNVIARPSLPGGFIRPEYGALTGGNCYFRHPVSKPEWAPEDTTLVQVYFSHKIRYNTIQYDPVVNEHILNPWGWSEISNHERDTAFEVYAAIDTPCSGSDDPSTKLRSYDIGGMRRENMLERAMEELAEAVVTLGFELYPTIDLTHDDIDDEPFIYI